MFPSGSTVTCVIRLGSRGVSGLSSSSSTGCVGAVLGSDATGRRSHAAGAKAIATIISRMRIRPLMRRANVSEASWRSMPATKSHQCHQWGGEKSDGAGLGHGEEGRTRRKRRALNADVEVDDAVVVDVDFSVVIEVA